MEQSSARPEFLRLQLRQKATKATPARLAILDLLTKSKEPLRVETIVRQLKHGFDQATVYRTMQTLLKSGLVRRVDFQQGHAYYELAEREEHHHAVCTACGKIEDIHDCCAETMERVALSQSGFASITHHCLEFFGLCQRCARKKT